MPLAAEAPRIDDRRYEDLMAEVRTRIPRYTPEWTPSWTDLNESDPGVTLVEVFAWLTDLTLYRLNRVPALAYVKFLELLGIELRPAEPARVEVTFPVLPSAPSLSVVVPRSTQLSADAGDGQPPLAFETDIAMTALRSSLVAVLAYDGFAFEAVTDRNAAATDAFQPFGPLATPGSALYLGFDGPIPPGVEIAITFFGGPPTASSEVRCGLPASTVYPSARLSWESWNGKAWQSLRLLKDETSGLLRSGRVHFQAPALIDQPADFGGVTGKIWLRVRILAGGYEQPPELIAIRTNTTSASQAETFRDEVVGGSDGRPNQVLSVENAPVVAGSLVLEVDDGGGFVPWIEVEDFFASGPDDQHYVLDRTSGTIRFGDDVSGRIPVANQDNPGASIVARSYRAGGGQRGNVGAGLVKTLNTAVLGVDEAAITNLQPAFGGRDEESLEAAKRRAPRALRSQCRAVTSQDFETLAQEAANVRRAKALPLRHPDFPGVDVPGVVTVVVVPDAPASVARPMPQEGTLRTVCAYLDQRRLLTTEVYVVAPTYQEVTVTAEVIARDDADLAQVKLAVEAALLEYFHPLRGGDDKQGWPFGGDIFYSRVQYRIFSVPGVDRVERLTITLDGEEAPACTDVPVPESVLLFCTANEVDVSYAVSA